MQLGSGCGSVGGEVASNTKGPRFESSHWQKFIYLLNICLLSTVYWKDENKEKRGWEWPIFKKNQMQILLNQIKQFNHFTYLFPVLSPQLHLSVIDLKNKWPIYTPNRRLHGPNSTINWKKYGTTFGQVAMTHSTSSRFGHHKSLLHAQSLGVFEIILGN